MPTLSQRLRQRLWLGLLMGGLWAGPWGGVAQAQAPVNAQAQAPSPTQIPNSSTHPSGDNPDDSAIWQKVRASLFQNRPITSAGQDVIALDAPTRAEDAAVVPIALRAGFPQTPQRFIDKIYLVIDNNPSPISATFHFTQLSGRADIETRVRIEQYTFVRAIAQTNDGRLYMATRFVKAAGGCSAPPGKDAQAALASLGRIRLRVDDQAGASQPLLAQLMVSHPNTSGLVMDQVTRLYAPAHFVRALRVTLDAAPVLSAELDISISENPNLRFFVFPHGNGELHAEVDDSRDLHFQASVPIQRLGAQGPGLGGEPPSAQQVAPGVYLLAGAAGEATVENRGRIGNVGFIAGKSGVLVINTGTSYRHGQALLQAIRRVTDKPILLALVTHTRPEFLLGAAAFQAQGVPVWMQHKAAELMRTRCERCLKKLTTLLGMEAMQGSVIFKPDQEFEQPAALAGIGRNIQILYFGHSSGPGDVAVLDAETGTLFAGGLLDNQRIPDVQDGDAQGWHSALQSLRGLSVRQIVPGHGAVGSVQLIDGTERYLNQLERRVADLLNQGTPLAAITEAATLPEFASWHGYATMHPRNATATYLRLERVNLFKP
jgi:quinoprotein dehydrogenase-associated SoxYZ-like carrier